MHTGIQAFMQPSIYAYRYTYRRTVSIRTSTQVYRHTGLKGYRHTGMQGYRHMHAYVQAYR